MPRGADAGMRRSVALGRVDMDEGMGVHALQGPSCGAVHPA